MSVVIYLLFLVNLINLCVCNGNIDNVSVVPEFLAMVKIKFLGKYDGNFMIFLSSRPL